MVDRKLRLQRSQSRKLLCETVLALLVPLGFLALLCLFNSIGLHLKFNKDLETLQQSLPKRIE